MENYVQNLKVYKFFDIIDIKVITEIITNFKIFKHTDYNLSIVKTKFDLLNRKEYNKRKTMNINCLFNDFRSFK